MGTDTHVDWKNHVEQITKTLSSDCHKVKFIYYFNNADTIKMRYFASNNKAWNYIL
jgi:hypothetical protein